MELKVKNIADRTRDIFLKYGIRSVSMDDISRELGMSKKTLYQHFGNKSDLVSKVMQHSFEEFEKAIDAIRDKKQNAMDDLLEMSRIIFEQMQEGNLSVSFDLRKYYPEIHSEYMEKKRKFASGYLRQNIEKGISEGLYRHDLNMDLIARLYIRKIEDLHHPDFQDIGKNSFAEVFHVMFENHIRGIASHDGMKYFEERKKTLKINW